MKNTFQNRLIEALTQFCYNTAIEYGTNILSYGELDYYSDLVAKFIIDSHIEIECFVALLIEDKIKFIIVAIGVLKAGCVIVPLDIWYPEKKILNMLRVAKIEYIFTDEKQKDTLIECNAVKKFVIGTDFFGKYHQKSESIKLRLYNPDGAIYVYFTSGTTGDPKAIVGKNKSLLQFINWEIKTFLIDTSSRVSQFTTPCHDPWLRDIFVPLFAGGVVCIPDNEKIILESATLINWVEQHKISLIHCTPSLFRNLNNSCLNGHEFPNLKYILMAGERIYPAELLSWYNKFGDRIQLVNLYGSTETTMIKTYYLIQPSDVKLTNIPIGKPMDETNIILFDEDMNVCLPGNEGEIYIQTQYSTHGYFENSELNSKKFIRNPLSNDPVDLIYKTGDIGRILQDGNIEFLGRIDRQVKIRGMRVEPGEIENILVSHERIKEAAVTFKDMGNGTYESYAYIVENKEATEDCYEETLEESLGYYLEERLPSNMIPSYILKLDEMPLLPNKKIDYCTLSKTDTVSLKILVEANDPIERLIAEFCKEILNKNRIGMNENFMQIGGHSLNAMSLVSKIYQELGIEVPLRQILSAAPISEIAEYIKNSYEQLLK